MKERIILVVGAMVLLAVGALLWMNFQTNPAVVQPIGYEHRVHTKFLECSFCHGNVLNDESTKLPSVSKCMSCHQGPVTDNPEAEKIKQYADKGEEIPWVKMFSLVDHVTFTHKAHVEYNSIECKTCHGDVAGSKQIDSGFGRNGANGPYGMNLMKFCTDCHEARGASTDCLTCHK